MTHSLTPGNSNPEQEKKRKSTPLSNFQNMKPPEDTPEAVAQWKHALESIEGLWEDRTDSVEEMNAIRESANRSFPQWN